MFFKSGDVLCFQADYARGRIRYGRVYPLPLPEKRTRRSRRRHRGQTRRVWLPWIPIEKAAR